ncbi:MAG: response regulator [Acidobacteriaceae bacterium]
MTTEQNQPPTDNPVPAQAQAAPQGQSHGEGGGRRRRRRRKRNKGSAQANGQGQNQAQPQSQQQPYKPKPPKPQPSSQTRFFKNNGNGQHQGGGGGGRRRNKQRRERVFVGPMDHSYRTVNGNVADSPPSTIEFRNGNLNGNGYHAENAASWEPPPPPVREDAPTRIYLFIEDLFFFAKINETARKLGIKVAFVKNDPETIAKIVEGPEEERPSLIVFDLNNAAAKPMALIPKIKSKLKKGTSVIGFLSHLQGDLKAKAVEAGCDIVMPRSAFSQNLPTLLRRHGLDEEQEAEYAQPF